MPRFSQESVSKLSQCHIDLQVLFFEIIKTFDCTILIGHRNEEDQEKAFKEGNSKLNWPNGKHNSNPSNAVDVSPYPIDWNNTKRFYWFAGYVMATAQQLKNQGKITHSIRFGGNWNGNIELMDKNGLNDLVHFEIIE